MSDEYEYQAPAPAASKQVTAEQPLSEHTMSLMYEIIERGKSFVGEDGEEIFTAGQINELVQSAFMDALNIKEGVDHGRDTWYQQGIFNIRAIAAHHMAKA